MSKVVQYWPILAALVLTGAAWGEARLQVAANAEDIHSIQQQQEQINDLRERAARAEANTQNIQQEQTEQRALLIQILREVQR